MPNDMPCPALPCPALLSSFTCVEPLRVCQRLVLYVIVTATTLSSISVISAQLILVSLHSCDNHPLHVTPGFSISIDVLSERVLLR